MNVSAIIVTRGDQDYRPVLASLPTEWERLVWTNGHRCEKVPAGDSVVRWSTEVPDLSVYGRYAAIEYTDAELIYVQDDDCVVSDPQQIVAEWQGEAVRRAILREEPHRHVVCNQPEAFRHDFYEHHSLVGFGACFHRDAPARAFDLFEERCGLTTYLEEEPEFKREIQGNVIAQTNSPHRKWERGRGWLTNQDFWRTCDIVFTCLTPRVLVDVPVENLPWYDAPNRMWKQPKHMQERTKMLELVKQVKA